MGIFRWKAIVPAALAGSLVILLWVLFIDRVIRRTIEFVGTELVGARVELASARLRFAHADLTLRGLQVSDPQQPMRNLVEVPEIVADLDGGALIEAKIIVDTVAMRGVRFGTPRRESGASVKPSPSTGLVTRRLLDWAHGIPIPTLDLRGLAGTVVRVDAISGDSLRTPKEVRAAQAAADSLQRAWSQSLRGLDPQPLIDSARALSTQLGQTDLHRLNPVQVATQANAIRTMVQRLGDMKSRLSGATGSMESGVARLHGALGAIDAARRADYGYARGLLNLPSFGGPDISMALFGRMMTDRLKPVLYWMNLADQYVPPGLDPRRNSGPKRARMAGTTFTFPKERALPAFLLRHADADFAVSGRTVAAGTYRALVTGATTEPAIYGRPMFFSASRNSGVGPRDLRIGGMMDRSGHQPRDSVNAFLPGTSIPAIAIPAAHASLDLGDACDIELVLARSGSELTGAYRITSDAVRWTRTEIPDPAAAARIGTTEWGAALLWRSLSAVPHITIEGRISGPPAAPQLEVTSNVGEAVADNLRQALGAEAQRAEAEARARVDALVEPQVAAARQRLGALESGVAQRLGVQQQQLDDLKADLQQKLSQLSPGIHLPGIPGLRRP